MPGTASIGGLISGLKTDDIITKMMDIAKRSQLKMQADKAEAQVRMTTWQDLNTRLSAVKLKIDNIAVSGAFQTCQASSSNSSVLVASAGAAAEPGSYYMTVKTRAQGHQLSGLSSGTPATPFTSTSADVGTGDVNFVFTDDPNKNFKVTINGTNNTLTGLRDAINQADGGVQASIINSGNSSTPAYQLLLTSTDTGAVSKFTASGDPAIKVNFSTIVQNGTDAEIQFGGGDGGTPITVKKSTNTITDLIDGVTLNVITPDPTKTIKVDVVRNTSGIKSSIQDFVLQYNDLTDVIDAQFKFDAVSGQSGTLMGDWDLQSVQARLASIVGGSVKGVDAHFSALATIGITQDVSGHLQIDDTALSNALADNLSDVSRLFASEVRSDSIYISSVAFSTDTQPSPTAGWDVNITQAARQTQVTAAYAFTSALDADESLNIHTGSSASKTVTLSSGWLLDRSVAEINKYSKDTGAAAVATKSDGTVSSTASENTYLTIKSLRYGSGSAAEVNVFSSLTNSLGNNTGIGTTPVSSAEPLGESGTGTGLAGLDVVGSINGETCTGTGQVLAASSADPKSAIKGLMLLITSSAPIASKAYFTKGLGTSLRDSVIDMTSTYGTIASIKKSIETEMTNLDNNISNETARLSDQSDRLYAQFNAMEAQLSKLQSQGSYLTQQFAAMNKPAA